MEENIQSIKAHRIWMANKTGRKGLAFSSVVPTEPRTGLYHLQVLTRVSETASVSVTGTGVRGRRGLNLAWPSSGVTLGEFLGHSKMVITLAFQLSYLQNAAKTPLFSGLP